MANINSLTIKAQEALQNAVALARSNSQQAVEPLHLLGALVAEDDSLGAFLLGRVGVNVRSLRGEVAEAVRALPKVEGGEPFFAGDTSKVVQRAIDFVSADRQTGLLNMMAAIYASGNQVKKSRAVYEQVLSSDANNREALMGMARLALQSGSAEEAKTFLEKAAKASGKESAGIEMALLHMMNNNLDQARLEMQKITDMHPKSLQAWSLLAGVLLHDDPHLRHQSL